MELSEFQELTDLVSDEVAAVIHAQTVLADIHQKLDLNRFRPFEQDIIYAEQYGGVPSNSRTFEYAGVKITTRILHQTGKGLADIRGGDLLYEIEGEKYIITQFKKADSRGKVQNNKPQLDALLKNCPGVCMYKRRGVTGIPARLNGFCGVWYRIDQPAPKRETHYVHACEAKKIFDNHGSVNSSNFRSGLTKETFIELFAYCRIGALTRVQPSQAQIDILVAKQELVFEAIQTGRWE